MSYTKEIWLDIPGYEGLYQISNLGNVKSYDKKCKGRYEFALRSVKGKVLKYNYDKDGYGLVHLYNSNGRKVKKVHRLVAQLFVLNNDESLNQVNHKNGIKSDNRAENLEWVNDSLNRFHAYRTGLQSKPQGMKGKYNIGGAPKNVVQKHLDGSVVKIWPSIAQVYRDLGFMPHTISRCAKGIKTDAFGFKWEFFNK